LCRDSQAASAGTSWQPYGEPGAFNDYDSTELGYLKNTAVIAVDPVFGWLTLDGTASRRYRYM
jgi:hypothetical protein